VEVVPWDLMVLRVVLAKMGPVIIRTVLVMGGQQEQEGAIQELQERMWTMDAVILEQLAQLEVQVPTAYGWKWGKCRKRGSERNDGGAGGNGGNGGGGAAGATSNGAGGPRGSSCGTDCNRDGRASSNGTAGAQGTDASTTAPAVNSTFGTFWVPNGQSSNGTDGAGGGGGKGGGGGAGKGEALVPMVLEVVVVVVAVAVKVEL
jgi:hypothetical protein